jgi:nucleotide-binding universal stress UspA family protein
MHLTQDQGGYVFTSVIVGVDDQPSGRDAIALATDFAGPGGEFTLAHVHLGDPGYLRSSSTAFEEAERQRSLALLDAVREEARVQAGRICIGSSSVGRGLHELAERQRPDPLVVGSCRRGLIGRNLLGRHPGRTQRSSVRSRRRPGRIRKPGERFQGDRRRL